MKSLKNMGKAFQGWGLNEKHDGSIFFYKPKQMKEKKAIFISFIPTKKTV